MMNYQQIETLTYDRQATFLAEADQRRLAQYAATNRPQPMRAWVGQRLIAWGQRLTSSKATPVLPLAATSVAR